MEAKSRSFRFAAICGVVAASAFAYDVNPGNADDAAAINAAIAAAAAEGGSGKVTLAGGTYFLTTPVTLNAAVELVGNDADRSKVVFDGANKYRLIEVTKAGAFVHGIRFERGYSDKTDNYYHGPVYMSAAGVISNCTMKMSTPGRYCGGVGLGAGTIVDCDITGCSTSDGGGASYGGALRLYGATCVADRLVITNNSAKTGAGVYLKTSGAKLINSLVADNSAGGNAGGGIYAESGTVVSNCVVRGNTGGNGGGIYMKGGMMIDTLVTGCTGTTGGGIYKESGTLRNCTVAGNTASKSAPGVYQSGGSIVSSVLWNNGSAIYRTAEASLVMPGGSCTYTCAAMAPSGNGNINNRLPAFADAANGDYTLSVASPCRGAGEDGVDMGYRQYEAPAAARCSFAYAFAEGKAPAEVTFTAALEGEYGAVTGYGWDFGDGSAADTTSGATATHVFQSAGRYTVTLTVVTSAGTLTYAVPNAVNLGSDEGCDYFLTHFITILNRSFSAGPMTIHSI